jgi:hypothetical protein
MAHEPRGSRATNDRMTKASRRVPALVSPERRDARSSSASRFAVGMAAFALLVGPGVVSSQPLPAAASTVIVQLGGDIDGEVAGDWSGFSVSLSADGSRVAVGAPRNSGAGLMRAGHVRIFAFNGTAWIQVGGDIDGEAANDWSGSSVSLSADGSRVAIGARFNAGGGSSRGHVRVYDWSGAAWVQAGGDIDGEADGDNSGFSVALSGDGSRVAIGAPSNGDAGPGAGHVRVYAWSGTAWTQVGGDIDGEAAGDNSGFRVASSADGSRVAIGAPQNDIAGTRAGYVRIFSTSGTTPAPPEGPVPPSIACGPLPATVGAMVSCTVTGGDPSIDILWRAAYGPVFAEAGVALDVGGKGEFSFVVPAAAFGAELTVELVEWLAPLPLGTVSSPVPTSIPSGEGPVPAWGFVLFVLTGGLMLRRVLSLDGRG